MAKPVSSRLTAILLCGAAVACTPRSPAVAPILDLSEKTPMVLPTASAQSANQPSSAEPASASLGTLKQPLPMRMDEQASALYAIGAFPSRNTKLRPGPEDDRRLVEINCVGCHSTAYITMQPPLSRAGWESEVQKMRSAFGAVIADPVASRIAAYLYAYYGSGK